MAVDWGASAGEAFAQPGGPLAPIGSSISSWLISTSSFAIRARDRERADAVADIDPGAEGIIAEVETRPRLAASTPHENPAGEGHPFCSGAALRWSPHVRERAFPDIPEDPSAEVMLS